MHKRIELDQNATTSAGRMRLERAIAIELKAVAYKPEPEKR